MTFHSLRFDRAAASYGAHSRIQERMADFLLDLHEGPEKPGSILELGSGTGNLTRRLAARFPGAAIAATDAAPRMLDTARTALSTPGPVADPSALAGAPTPAGAPATPIADRIRWFLFDVSGTAPVPGPVRQAAPFALAASNALIQWFPDPRPHLSQVRTLLAPSGSYLVSGFSRNNFPELNAILRDPPFSYPDYPGHLKGDILAAAADAGFRVEEYREESIETEMPSAQAFLDSIRGLGSARRPESDRPLTRARLRRLLDSYQERYSMGQGIRATWKPWYARLRKPD